MMPDTRTHIYALALGSNRPLSAQRSPAHLLDEAVVRIGAVAKIMRVSPTIETAPIGPSRRRFANGALLVESALAPRAMLTALQSIERDLGRKRFKRWGARSVDIDIILWSGGGFSSRTLTIPHVEFRRRGFVLTPLRAIAPGWRDPRTGLAIRHLAFRLGKAASKG